ncbi:FAD-dependent oxidoreductase [uncultured Pigmentiphaga sp.]|uniref:NAD(P)/FAD-dependent oxidoreductase n=1 Tax=uncultured Pigmentiphaga sp. TaxID=340361 RepID=UPI00260404CB|nr:FAD-dependent oxidoreductase [uncultured Pigmentiphaga sp.]
MEETFLIVGAGQAAGYAAHTLRAEGYQGRLVLVGDEPWGPYERPALSKDVLLAEADENCFDAWLYESGFRDATIAEQLAGRVVRLDTARREAWLESGEKLGYDKCLLATGGHARPLGTTPPSERVAYLRTLDDAMRLRGLMARSKSVAIIGGGFLGLEIAASAAARGLDATVFETAPRLLGKAMPPEFGDRLLRKHERHGVRVMLNARPVGVSEHASAVVVAGEKESSVHDFCVIAVGQAPNDQVARASGIEVSDGIVVDEHCRTSAPGVYAAGDCASFPSGRLGRRARLESWQHAKDQAIAAARNMLGITAVYDPTPWFWTDQYDWNIQMLGLMDESIDRWVERPGPDDKTLLMGLRGQVVVYALALNQGGELRALKRIVEQGIPVDPDRLADPSVKLRRIEQASQ